MATDKRVLHIKNKLYQHFGLTDPSVFDEFLRTNNGVNDFLLHNFISQKAADHGFLWGIVMYKEDVEIITDRVVIDFMEVETTISDAASTTSTVSAAMQMTAAHAAALAAANESKLGDKKKGNNLKGNKEEEAVAEIPLHFEPKTSAEVLPLRKIELVPFEKVTQERSIKSTLYGLRCTDWDEHLFAGKSLLCFIPTKETSSAEIKNYKGSLDSFYEIFHVNDGFLKTMNLTMNTVSFLIYISLTLVNLCPIL